MSENDFLKGSWLCKLVAIHQKPCRVFEIEAGRLKGIEFCVRWISSECQVKAIDDAKGYLIDRCKWDPVDLYSGAGAQRLEFESRVRLLALALVEPNAPTQPAAASADELRGLFDTDEVNRLYEEWDSFQAERSPWRRWKTAADFEADVDALGKGLMQETWTRSCDTASLRNIVQSLVARLQKQTKRSLLDTSQVNDSGDASTKTD